MATGNAKLMVSANVSTNVTFIYFIICIMGLVALWQQITVPAEATPLVIVIPCVFWWRNR